MAPPPTRNKHFHKNRSNYLSKATLYAPWTPRFAPEGALGGHCLPQGCPLGPSGGAPGLKSMVFRKYNLCFFSKTIRFALFLLMVWASEVPRQALHSVLLLLRRLLLLLLLLLTTTCTSSTTSTSTSSTTTRVSPATKESPATRVSPSTR